MIWEGAPVILRFFGSKYRYHPAVNLSAQPMRANSTYKPHRRPASWGGCFVLPAPFHFIGWLCYSRSPARTATSFCS